MPKAFAAGHYHHSEQLQHLANTIEMPGASRPSILPPATTYQDHPASYSVSSFNIAAQCDSSLLTPISASASPPSSFTKYPESFVGSGNTQQQPSPPTNTNMYPWPFPSEASTGPAPPSMHRSAGNGFVAPGFVSDRRQTPEPPSEFYMGSFGVSNTREDHRNPYYAHSHGTSSPELVDTSMHMNLQRSMVGGHPSSATLPSQHSHLSHNWANRDSEPMITFSRSSSVRGVGGSPRSRGATRGRGQRGRGRGRGGNRRNSNRTDDDVPVLDEWQNCHGETVPPTLKDGTPDVERMIFDLRWEHRQRKGENMWSFIQRDVHAHFQEQRGSPSQLQMKYARARPQWIQWLDKDIELLNQAWHECQSEWYSTILKRFLDLGGSPNMDTSANDIESKIVNDLKLEHDMYIERHLHNGLAIRRRVEPPPSEGEEGKGKGKKKRKAARDPDTGEPYHYSWTKPDYEVIDDIWRIRGDSSEMMDMAGNDEDGDHAGHGQE